MYDKQDEGWWAKLTTNGRRRYIGSAFFDIENDFENAEHDPTKPFDKDFLGRPNVGYDKVFDEELELYKMDENNSEDEENTEDKEYVGEVNVTIKIKWSVIE